MTTLRRRVRSLLLAQPKAPTWYIAEVAGCSRSTVRSVRAELER